MGYVLNCIYVVLYRMGYRLKWVGSYNENVGVKISVMRVVNSISRYFIIGWVMCLILVFVIV